VTRVFSKVSNRRSSMRRNVSRNFGAVTYIDPNLQNPQTQQYSLTVKRELI
jgi:hypothetical protein